MTTILSWNVNGVRAITRNGFLPWLEQAQPDILCLQETRAMPEDLEEEVLRPNGYISLWNPAKKKGYSGTAAYVKTPPKAAGAMSVPQFDDEGRLQVLEYEDFTILNGYWPNSQAERARLDYKLEYCTAIVRFANKLVKQGKQLVLCGDFNIAHTEIDLARPKENENSAGYYIEERQAMTRFLGYGYVDVFRHLNPATQQYTWWSYRGGARARNVGWRIDYHCVSENLLPRVKRAWICGEVTGSDHCPVGVEIE